MCLENFMKVELEDVLFWMDAIRNSDDRYRTLESFWKGQVHSKEWLVKSLEEMNFYNPSRIVIYGGWNGVLASLIFNSKMNPNFITSVDIDPTCQEIANTVNKRYEIGGKFKAITADMCEYSQKADIVINTSCEHISQAQYEQWLSIQSNDAWYVLQGNDYFDCDEHVRCATDIDDFTRMSKIKPFWRGELETQKYTRYMIIGKKK
jgi:hypothetical protein